MVRTVRFLLLHAQGPLSDQVADAPGACGQCRSWVDIGCSLADQRTAAVGRSVNCRLLRVAAIYGSKAASGGAGRNKLQCTGRKQPSRIS